MKLFWLALAIVSVQSPSAAQTRADTEKPLESYHPIDREVYDQTLNLVFSRAPLITKGIIFTMTIRFIPAFDSESQLLVTFFADKAPSVEYEIAERQIYLTANEAIRSGVLPEPAAIAKIIRVRRSVFAITNSRALAWQQDLLQSFGATLLPLRVETQDLYQHGTRRLVLDGKIYEVGYDQGSTELHGRFDQTSKGPAIAKWAESVRMEILRRQAQH
jgi:hypothetical protein